MREIRLSPWMLRYGEAVFLSSCLVLLLCLSAAIVSGYYYLALIPLAILGGIMFLLKPLWLLMFLWLVLPLSMEYEIGSFGTDLPSEPLAILLAGISLVWLLQRRFGDVKSFVYHPFTWVLLLHVLWVILITPMSQQLLVSIKYLLSKVWYIAGFFIGTYWLINKYMLARWALSLLLLTSVGSVSFVMLEHLPDRFTFDSINAACNPLYRNHVTYGVFLAMILPLLVYARNWTNAGKLNRLLIDSAIALVVAGLYFSYTRGAWLAVPAMLGAWLALRWKMMRWVVPAGFLAAILFFISLSQDYKFLRFAPNYDTTIYHEDFSDHMSATFQGEDMSTMERFHRWIAAFRMSKEYPLFGVGPNNFVEFYQPYTVSAFETYVSDNEERSTVHNYFILMLVEQGYPGLLIALLLAGVFLIYGEREYHRLNDPKYQRLYLACILCGVAFWLNNLFSDLVEANKLAPLWLMVMALMIRIGEWDKKAGKIGSSTVQEAKGQS